MWLCETAFRLGKSEKDDEKTELEIVYPTYIRVTCTFAFFTVVYLTLQFGNL